jgi:hypothetical protein
MKHSALEVFIHVISILNVILGAAFAGLLVRATRVVWQEVGRVEKWLSVALFLYSANVAIAAPLLPNIYLQFCFLVSFIAGHKGLYFARKDTS